MIDPVLLSVDADWAPDFMIDFIAAMLLERRVRATWFVTHRSAAVERLKDHPELFELGIHPNFREGSTQGSTPEEVLRHCLELVPDAVTMRTHSFVQSTPLLTMVAATTPIRIDASMLLPRVAGLQPFVHPFGGRPLLRVPCDWEDDVEMEFADPRWDARAALAVPGMRTFAFHPVHVYLNSADIRPYHAVRARLTRLTADEARASVHEGTGTQTFLCELVAAVDPERTMHFRDML